ncbi:MAG TPA: MarR family transcriptional regulator [Gemmatimonadaceae bacterium]|nr:MarR family transcriptional regulator [Gemmatimonadaceae bacterium]
MDATTEWFIEQVGMSAEADGLPRIAGRLFGLLLLSPGPRSLDDIAEALGVSKASVSIDARLLLKHGWLRRVTLPGDRRDYYEMSPDFFAGIVAYRVARWEALHDLVAEARHRLPQHSNIVRERLRYLDDVQRFFLAAIRDKLVEWRRSHPEGAPSATPAGGEAADRAHTRPRGKTSRG